MMLKQTLRGVFAAALLVTGFAVTTPATAAEGVVQPPRQSWSWSGPFGRFDRAQLQRGFQVYKEVCSACHSLSLVAFRNLSQPGGPEFPADQMAQIAKDWLIKVKDLDDSGEVKEREPRPADRIPAPFANAKAAAAAMGGKAPPDLSLMPKARTYERGFPWFVFDIFTQYQEQGADYLHALLTGYHQAPKGVDVPAGSNYNLYFPGNLIAMAQPISDGQVEYSDGSPKTVDQYSRDVTAFLMWTAEPQLEARKSLGLKVMFFLLIFGLMMTFVKRKVWANVAH